MPERGVSGNGGEAPGSFGRQPLERPRSLPEQIADECGSLIMSGAFRGGERLTEQELAERFDVSRGPVRESLRLLEKRRLVELRPRRGVYVRRITLATVSDLFEVRIALACLAARTMAARNAPSFLDTFSRRIGEMRAMMDDPETDPLEYAYLMTRAVHTVVRGSGNELIADIWRDMNESSFWTTIWRHPLDAQTVEIRRARWAAYAEIETALHARDAEGAQRAMSAALIATRDLALEILDRERPGAFAD